ncbi:MAG: 5-formyltetrahydrofolate cyclo-ligase [Syntrophomonadaceae bacterium]|nr:5-formyltetrahydrofolate cyclo-ligase [Syntrophomonadaceae bacterium]
MEVIKIKTVRQQMREEMSAKRKELVPEEVKQYSEAICNKLQELVGIENARTIMGFSSFGNEVQLMPWLESIADEKQILLPRVEKGGLMVAVPFTGWENVKSGPFGIKEPIGEPFDLKKIDVVIVPGLVFDYKGYRLGYGKGYYDRFLKELQELRNDVFLCGVCYDFQIIDTIHPHERDVPVHWIVTEKSELVVDWNHF